MSQRPFYIVRKNLRANRFHKHGDWAFVRVKSLANRRTEKVYQIEVEEDHSYVSNGFVSKNCQDVSVAGKRAGMQEGSGTRSSLAFEFVRLARELEPRYIIWENVAGAIDSKNAPDFLAFLRALGDCGYTLAWRVLDAQYVRVDGMERAVPQRRRRVWVVGCLGADESRVAKILFEPDCVAGHTAPRRRTGEGFAYSLAGRDRVDAPVVGEPAARGDGGCLNPLDVQSKRIYQPSGSAPCLPSGGTEGMTIQPSVCIALDQGAGKSSVNTTVEHSPTLATTHQGEPAIALDGDKLKPREGQRKGGSGFGVNEEGAGCTLTGVDRHGVAYGMDARNTGLYGAGATGEEVSMTQDANQCKGGKCVVQCYENHAQDSRVKGPIDTAPTFGSSNANSMSVSGNNPLVCFSKVSHPHAPNGEGERWDEREVAQTRNTFDNGEKRCQEVVVSMAQNTRDEVRIIGGDGQIAGALPAEPGMKQQTYVVSTNSNGGDVAATINANMSKLGGDNQTTFGGGYVVSRRGDRT